MSDPNKNQETKEYIKKVTIGDILGKNTQKKQEKEQLQRETKDLHDKVQQKLQSLRSQENQENIQQETQNEQNNTQDTLQSTDNNQDKLYKQLAAKYNIPLHVLEKQDNQPKKNLSFSQYDKSNQQQLNKNQYENNEISEAQQFVIQQRVAQRRHISSFKKRKEIDPYMQTSFLDKQQEDQPEVMRYMENHREFQPMMNIGDRTGDMIKKNAVKQMKYEMALTKGDGYLWHAVKTGKLGVDLYLCTFAAIGMFVIPYYFYKVQQKRMELWRKNRGITKDVEDFEEAGFDLDDLSINENHMNMFKDERLKERKENLDKFKEIHDIMDSVLKNK